jgi:hypothetical protein
LHIYSLRHVSRKQDTCMGSETVELSWPQFHRNVEAEPAASGG